LSSTSEEDRSSISSGRHRSDSASSTANGSDTTQNYSDEYNRERRPTTSGLGGVNIFSKFKGLFGQGITNYTTDSFNRTSTYCVSASIPAREINHWVRI